MGAGASSRSGKAGGGLGRLKLDGVKNTLAKGGGGGKSNCGTWRENAGKSKGLPLEMVGGGANALKGGIDTKTPSDFGHDEGMIYL